MRMSAYAVEATTNATTLNIIVHLVTLEKAFGHFSQGFPLHPLSHTEGGTTSPSSQTMLDQHKDILLLLLC